MGDRWYNWLMLQIPLPPDTETKLRERASARGQDVSSYAAHLLKEALNTPSVDELLAPVREAYDKSGITEDESFDFLETEKHAMRRDRRADMAPG
jgi:hypothetical protein